MGWTEAIKTGGFRSDDGKTVGLTVGLGEFGRIVSSYKPSKSFLSN